MHKMGVLNDKRCNNKNRKAFFALFVIGYKHSKLSLDFWALFSKKCLSALISTLGQTMRIICGNTAQKLSENVAKDGIGGQAAI